MLPEMRRKKQQLPPAEAEAILRAGSSGVLALAGEDAGAESCMKEGTLFKILPNFTDIGKVTGKENAKATETKKRKRRERNLFFKKQKKTQPKGEKRPQRQPEPQKKPPPAQNRRRRWFYAVCPFWGKRAPPRISLTASSQRE